MLLRREQLWSHSGKLEARYLRFLRTKEQLSNYSVVKTIGKGYFGEVKLVRKIQDGRVYALKRLFKSEMISKEQLRKSGCSPRVEPRSGHLLAPQNNTR
jgi:protein-serine/threonine kinase